MYLQAEVGTIIHEIGHAVGFFHEQARPDRDDHVTIHPENIEQGMESNFKKQSEQMLTTNDIPYDHASIMHYGTHVSKCLWQKKSKMMQKPLVPNEIWTKGIRTWYFDTISDIKSKLFVLNVLTLVHPSHFVLSAQTGCCNPQDFLYLMPYTLHLLPK